MGEPTEAAFDDPAARQDGKALLPRRAGDDFVVHAVQVAPETATLGGEGAIQDRGPQARPCRLVLIEGGKRVALLD